MTAAPPPAPAETIHLNPYVAGLVTVDVTINGETMPLIFDTGGGATVVTPEFAERFGCTPWGRAVGHRMRGEAIEAQICGPMGFTAGSASVSDTVGVFDLASLLPPELPPVGGILALSAFEDRAVTLDLGGRQLIVETEASLRARVGTREGLPLRQQRELTGLALTPFVPVESDPGPLWFLVDSGHNGPVFLAPHAVEILNASGHIAQSDEGATMDVRLDQVAMNDVRAGEIEILYDGVFGAPLLEHIVITFDFAKDRVWIVPRDTE